MAAGTYNFDIEQGTTFDQEFQWKDSNSVAINLTGYTVRMMARSSIADSTVQLDASTTNSKIVLSDAVNGKFKFNLTAAETAAFNWPTPSGYSTPVVVYDIEMVSGAGKVTRLLKGSITLDLEVIR